MAEKSKWPVYVISGLAGAIVMYILVRPSLVAAEQIPMPTPKALPETKWGFFSKLAESIGTVLAEIAGGKKKAETITTSGVIYL